MYYQSLTVWLCRGKNVLFAICVEIGCTGKLLQGEMCCNMTRLIMKNMPVVAVALNIPSSSVYT